MRYEIKIKPEIPPRKRHAIEDNLEKIGYDVHGGGQGMGFSDITFSDGDLLLRYKTLITYLDCALTNKAYHDCVHTFRNSAANTPEAFLDGELYYLSDGGYSRIRWDDGIVLVSESRQEVKKAWARCKELIADINEFLGCYMREEV